MLRNLIYSFCCHILFIAFLFISTFEFAEKISTTKATPLTISFINDNSIEDLEKVETGQEDERVKDLKLEEKVDLYNKLKNQEEIQKEIERISQNDNNVEQNIENNINNKINNNDNNLEENKQNQGSQGNKNENIEDGEANTELNEFNYYNTPVYVAEDKVNTEEKRKLIENRIKKEELRKKIKERNAVPDINFEELKQIQDMNTIVKLSLKPLHIAKEKNEKRMAKAANMLEEEQVMVSNENKDDQNNNSDEIISEVDKMALEMDIKNNIIDEKYAGLDEKNIFNKEDIEKLKEIEEEKNDKKYSLSLREKRNIQRQIKGCYKMAILRSKKDSKAVVALTVNIEKNGIINMNNIKVNMVVDDFENGYEIAVDNAKSALVFCSPLRGLPVGKYRSWRQMTFVFDSNKLE